jgi:hypothetical protein
LLSSIDKESAELADLLLSAATLPYDNWNEMKSEYHILNKSKDWTYACNALKWSQNRKAKHYYFMIIQCQCMEFNRSILCFNQNGKPRLVIWCSKREMAAANLLREWWI